MMRAMAILLLVCAVCAMAGWVPFKSGNVADLSPVEIVCFHRDGGEIVAVCDGGLAARGKSVAEAVENLHAAAPGRLFMETVDHAVFTELLPKADELAALGLRPAVGLYLSPVQVEDPDALAVYLRTHGGAVTLGMLEDGWTDIPLLEPGENHTLYIKEAKP